ncbi:MAG TPA: ABC transporter substrate-binding protein, partial [Kofleriaceae bacterium]|nr:ABC transporter substrate-binding protein [Kofleriaceae bacterium]
MVLALVVACKSDDGPRFRAAGSTTPRAGGTLHIALSSKIISLDPLIGSNDEQTSNVVHPLFDTLVDFAPDSLQVKPRLARSWDISADGLVYTFQLRDGIAYEDGRPIVAGDFKYALERTLQKSEAAGRGDLVDVVGADSVTAATGCAGISAPDDRTLVIKLAKRNAAFIYVMTMSFTSPERRDYVAAIGDQIRQRPLASGPYRLESWDEGQRIVLVHNPHYYDHERGRIERIEVLEDIKRDTQFLMFKRGELD